METINRKDMKTAVMAALSLMAAATATMSARTPQTPPSPQPHNTETSTVVYSLPMTSMAFEVEAVRENFYAGPYAKFAAKYLGIEVRQKDEVTYTLSKVRMTPYAEADLSKRYMIDLQDDQAYTTFLKLTASGLVSSAESVLGRKQAWRFPVVTPKDFASMSIPANLTTEATTLYKSVKSDSAYGKVAVKQDMLVEKSEEARAAEVAKMIFALREQRISIITGNTDASYTGEAMGAALDEINRLEKEFMSMFAGYSEYDTQKLSFDLTPQKDRENQIYIAFRISDTAGLLPADNLSGKPVVLEISPEPVSAPVLDGKKVRKSKTPGILCRIPATCNIKLTDGMTVILQSRVPVYQFGTEETFPLNLVLKTK